MCDDYFEAHYIDDLMEWENEQVFQDLSLEKEEHVVVPKSEADAFYELHAAVLAHERKLCEIPWNDKVTAVQAWEDFFDAAGEIDLELYEIACDLMEEVGA